jgi:polar amino acid transport system substrate-binding protein
VRRARHALILACGWLLAGCLGSAQATDVSLYAYHLKPPYIVDPKKSVGLYYELARRLNHLQSQHRYKTVYLPRKRLESLLEQEQLDGLVLGVNPHWFNDASQHRYAWSQPWIKDRDIVASRSDHPIAYSQPESLIGKRVGLSLGYYYFGINELADKGQLQRDDSQNEALTLEKLMLGRVDAMVITQRTLNTLYKTRPDYVGKIHIAPVPHDVYERHILVPHAYQALLPELNQALARLADDPQWQAMLKVDQ